MRAPLARAACVSADVLAPLSVEKAALDDGYPLAARKDEIEALTLERDGKKLTLERQGTSFMLRAPSEANVTLDAGNRRLEAMARAPAELVLHPDPKALGFEPEALPKLWGADGLEVTRWGTIKADFQSKRTSLEGVYAVGDIVRGASLVVWAIRDGREAADSILSYLDARSAAVAAE